MNTHILQLQEQIDQVKLYIKEISSDDILEIHHKAYLLDLQNRNQNEDERARIIRNLGIHSNKMSINFRLSSMRLERRLIGANSMIRVFNQLFNMKKILIKMKEKHNILHQQHILSSIPVGNARLTTYTRYLNYREFETHISECLVESKRMQTLEFCPHEKKATKKCEKSSFDRRRQIISKVEKLESKLLLLHMFYRHGPGGFPIRGGKHRRPA